MKGLIAFDIITFYKSGKKKNECVITKDADSLSRWFKKHHNTSLVTSYVVTDAFPV